MHTSKFIGSLLLLIGTMIGAGMLALPLVSATSGIVLSGIYLFGIWALMTVTGLLVLEVNLALPATGCSFSSMAEKTLGRSGKIIVWISCLLLLYALTSAYIAGAASLISSFFATFTACKVPNFISAIIFTLIFGGAVFWSTKVTDYTNRSLLSIKGVLLLVSLALLLPHIHFEFLQAKHNFVPGKLFFTIVPIFLCAFGYHTVIPSLRIYIGDKPKELRRMIILGTLIAFVVYFLWLIAILGVVPLVQMHGSIGDLIQVIAYLIHNNWVTVGINGFSNIAMTTSFLGVTLGLFDFLADGLKRQNTRFGRAQTALFTFLPPLIFVFYFPQGFVMALKYGAIFVTIITVILPALMAYQARKQADLSSSYRVAGGNLLPLSILLLGSILILLQVIGGVVD